MAERPEKETRVWDDPERARVTGRPERRKPSPRVGGIIAVTVFLGVFAFLWGFPTFSLVFLLGQEPVQITVTDCFNGSGKNNPGGCDGTWTLADGTTGEGRFTENRKQHEPGDVVDGVYIGGRAATSTTPWILDVAIVYPIAVLLTAGFAVMVVRDRRRQRASTEPERKAVEEEQKRAPAPVRVLGWSLLVCAYVFLFGFPTYSAFAMVTADPVAITVTDCLTSRGLTTRCHGEWTVDGKPGDGSIESWTKGLDDGEILDGMAIGGQVVHVPVTWILDLIIFYPLAALLTYVHLRVVRKARLDHERRDAAAAEPGTISLCEPPPASE